MSDSWSKIRVGQCYKWHDVASVPTRWDFPSCLFPGRHIRDYYYYYLHESHAWQNTRIGPLEYSSPKTVIGFSSTPRVRRKSIGSLLSLSYDLHIFTFGNFMHDFNLSITISLFICIKAIKKATLHINIIISCQFIKHLPKVKLNSWCFHRYVFIFGDFLLSFSFPESPSLPLKVSTRMPWACYRAR